MMVGISHCNYSKQSRKQTAYRRQETVNTTPKLLSFFLLFSSWVQSCSCKPHIYKKKP